MNNNDGTREQIKSGIESTVGSPTKGEETSTTQSELMSIMLEHIENGSLDFRTLVERFHKGAPQETQSWVGSGENQQIKPADVASILGPNDLRSISSEAGLPEDEVCAELAELLPTIIDKFTPEGWLPEGHIAQQAASDLASKIS
jgi:uncharacterized protein YidB (DUF937 family)